MISLRDITASELAMIEEGSIYRSAKTMNGEIVGIEKLRDLTDGDCLDMVRDNLSCLDEFFYEIEGVHLYFYHLKVASAWS